MNLEYEVKKLKEQVQLHEQLISYLAELNVRLVCAASDPDKLRTALIAEAGTSAGQRLKPLFDRLLAAAEKPG